jgi:serine/threonine-protein kinase
MSSPGSLLAGRYRLESRIAAGGVGEVWRAEDLVLARPVAVKLLQPGYASHPQTLARFRAEARHAGSLTHPGIAQVYDYGESGPAGAPYLVLELVDGPSLAGSLAAGPLGGAAAMDVVAQVAAGLAAAHAAGLVHRDVKPANLLMGRDGLVKITDFGIAHAAGSAPITQVGTLVGTPAYLAPERAAGQPATPASDLYSLGIVAFECLTGTLPFHGTPLEIASASRLQPLPPLPPAVPAAVAALVIDLTAKNPADRPGSAAEAAARAARLRDTLDAGLRPARSGRPGTAAVPPGRPPAPAHTAVLPDPQAPATEVLDWPSAGPGPGLPGNPGRGRPGRARAAWAAGLAVVVVALAAWLLASAGSGPPGSATRPPQASPAASTQGPATVTVNAAALVGQPVGAVRLRLARLGLRSQVVRSVTAGQRPGTVVSVQPSGRVTPGSVITVAAAARADHRHHQAKHHGDGNGGHGQGGD